MQLLRGLLSTLLLFGGRSLLGRGASAEQSINCVVDDGIVFPPEWKKSHNFTPSDLRDLQVTISATLSGTPLLNISWTLSPSGDITVLKATFFSIKIIDYITADKQFSIRCNYTEQFRSEYGPNRQPWTFYYDKFSVKPNTHYFIHAFNIPTANYDADSPSKSVNHTSPGCKDSLMKYSDSCVVRGSLWNPNISACIKDEKLEVNFSLHSYGTKHLLKLFDCPSPTDFPHDNCQVIDDADVIENNNSRPSVLLTLDGKLAYGIVQLYAILPACQKSCWRYLKHVDCIIRTEVTLPPETEPHQPATRIKLFIILLTVMCVLFGLAAALYCMWKHGRAMMPIRIFDASLVQEVKVLVVYPSESAPFQKTVLSFAEFLHDYCRADVILDLQQKRKLAEMGPVQWLVAQKETADKIIFLYSSSSGNSLTGSSAADKTNHRDANSPEKMFTLALNLFCSDLLDQSSLHKYMVVYFSETNPKGDLPSILRTLPTYCFMKDLNLFCEDLHTSPWIHKRPDFRSKENMKYLQKLQKKVLEQKQCQYSCPADDGEREHIVLGYN